jgi:shikimate dehydrogenase
MTRRLYAIVGDPIAQARSPAVFNERFAVHGIDAEMVALEVPEEKLPAVLSGLRAIRNFGGAVITVPHKIAATELAEEKSERVRIAGAANVLRPTQVGWSADLLDGEGFVAGLAAKGLPVTHRSAAIVGAGGAGLAIAAALLEARVNSVALHDRDAKRTASALARLSVSYPGRVSGRLPDRTDSLVVNATPTGMAAEDAIPIDLETLDPHAIVADAIMKPPFTRLLAEASRRGHPVLDGRYMLDGQIDAIWEFLEMYRRE